jgi:nitrogen-specific signal transduction histidine kinase
MNRGELALGVINQISAVVGYWDANLRCRFSNDAYEQWFGRTREQMEGISLQELLGPIYEKNLPHIRAALSGKKQVFERQILLPTGGFRESITTYTPDVVDGVVRGFYALVTDVTPIKQRELTLQEALKQRDDALAEVHTLRGLLPICAGCKNIQHASGEWQPIERYVCERSSVEFSHGFCPTCLPKAFPGFKLPE